MIPEFECRTKFWESRESVWSCDSGASRVDKFWGGTSARGVTGDVTGLELAELVSKVTWVLWDVTLCMLFNIFEYQLWLLFSLSTQPLVNSNITLNFHILISETIRNNSSFIITLCSPLLRLHSVPINFWTLDTDYRNTWTCNSRLVQHMSWSHCPNPLQNLISSWIVQCTDS